MNDRELLLLINEQDKKAYTSLYNKYWDDLYSYIYSRVKHHETSQDILQDLWVKVWQDSSFVLTNEQGSAKGFFISYLGYRVLDYFRAVLKKSNPIDDVVVSEIKSLGYTHILEDISVKDINQLIYDVLQDLPKGIMKIAELRWNNYSVSETAEQLSVTKKTVRNKYSIALNKIREKLKAISTKIFAL